MKTTYIYGITIGAALMAGFIGSFFTMDAIPTWYATLQKPPISPPNWVFGPVWSALYVLMGVAAGLVWQHEGVRAPLRLYFTHLVLNAFWSIAFFNLESPELALAVVVLLWLAIIALIVQFRSRSRLAALLMLPYLAWVSFASVLNAWIVLIN